MKNSMAYTVPGVKTMDDLIAEAFDVTVSEIKTSNRKGPGKDARFFAMWYLKTHTSLSLSQIGKMYSDRDHTTVLHAFKRVELWKVNDKAFKEKFEKALSILENSKVK